VDQTARVRADTAKRVQPMIAQPAADGTQTSHALLAMKRGHLETWTDSQNIRVFNVVPSVVAPSCNWELAHHIAQYCSGLFCG
jgi:hypothetical protein